MQETQLNGETLDIVSENVSKLKELFPEIVTEDKIDFDKLKEVLGKYTEDDNERYNFTWKGKSAALRLAQTPSTGTLRPCKEESKNWDTTENLYIEGDNLEVLKLLQKSYHNKIKLIYIDPPYNTGNDFVYPDNYRDNLQNYLELTRQIDSEGKNLGTNRESDGRYHTHWLSMIYPRLKLAWNLLTDDGVIFISIDDNEVNNLKKICDDIFGEDNFEASFYVKVRHETRILREDIRYQLVMEQILCYSKSSSSYAPNRIPKQKNPEDEYIYDVTLIGEPQEKLTINGYDVEVYGENDYKIQTSEPGKGSLKQYQIRGSLISQSGSASEYYEINLRKRREMDGLGTLYKVNGMGIKGDGLGYRYIMQPTKLESKNGFYFQGRPIALKKSKGIPYPNYYDFVQEANNVGYEGEIDFKNGKKPLALLKKVFEISNVVNDYNCTILDFFSGSATTAEAVMRSNLQDGGNRKYIMVQLPEDENNEAYKAGYKNICEIGKERIRRAGDKIVSEMNQNGQTSLDSKSKMDLDIGFKVFKLDSSNLAKWDPEYDNLEQTLLDSVENLVPGRNELDLVYEIMIKYGIDLTLPIEEYQIQDKNFYSIGFGALIICLNDNLTSDLASEIIKLKDELSPEVMRVVFKDNGFASDSDKTNIKETLKTNGIEEFVTI